MNLLRILTNNEDGIHLPKLENPPQTVLGLTPPYNRTSFCQLNYFMLSSLANMGGSDKRRLPGTLSYARFGGGLHDGYLALKLFSRDYTTRIPRFWTPAQLCEWLKLPVGGLKPYSVDDVQLLQDYNGPANPGPSYRSHGFSTKYEAYPVAFSVARYIESHIGDGFPGHMFSGVASRPKLKTIMQHIKKRLSGATCGRPVAMMDAHESILAGKFTIKLLDVFKREQSVVKLGFNKFGDSPKIMLAELRQFNVWVKGDFSSFDGSVCGPLIMYAFDVIRCAYGMTRGGASNDELLLDYLELEFIHTSFVGPDGRVHITCGGIPSGSGFTSIIGSICNAIVLRHGLAHCVNKRFAESSAICVYGDDNNMGLNSSEGTVSKRVQWAQEIVGDLSGYVKDTYGMVLSPDDTKVCPYLTVAYGCPKVPGKIENFSSAAIHAYRMDLQHKLGRKLNFSEKIRLLNEEPTGELTGGNTHRWTYVFSERLSFLQFYFKDDGRMIRPTYDVTLRLVHPENPVRTISDHKMLLISALIDNYHNAHTRNRIMHYLYDSWWMGSLGISDRALARGNYFFTLENPDEPTGMDDFSFPHYNPRNERVWYRKQTGVSDLPTDSRMSTFFSWFYELCEHIESIYIASDDVGSISWRYRKGLRSGLKGLGKYIRSKTSEKKSELDSWIRFINFLGILHNTSKPMTLGQDLMSKYGDPGLVRDIVFNGSLKTII